jgi:hypothetical protein
MIAFYTSLTSLFCIVDNIYVVFGGPVLQQSVGIPMGTNCAPLLTDLFLYSYEAEFVQILLWDNNKKKLTVSFNHTFRYIDDVLSINNHNFHNYVHLIYPDEFEIKDTTESDKSASYLDILLNIDTNGRLTTSLYDKRDDFNFAIVNFPFLCSNIPLSHAYGMYISQLIRYARACFAYDDFSKRCKLLTKNLFLQGYNESHLKSSFRTFYGRYNGLVCDYKLSLADMLNDLFLILCLTVIFILVLTTDNPVYLILTRADGGCDRSVEDAYSSMAPDPTFAFFGVGVALQSNL